jgi:NAD(P)-dependent dehydrogenase (short-subunit alcohol dehydrogenase family)
MRADWQDTQLWRTFNEEDKPMTRTYVVTGAASGIGKATSERLTAQGHKVIGVDLDGSDISADLATAAGRLSMVDEVSSHSGGRIDGILAIAGLAAPIAKTAAVNFYGAIATLDGLRPLLAGSDAPRAAVVASMASLFPPDEKLLAAFLDGTEEEALARAEELAAGGRKHANLIYGTSKQAVARWVRRNAPTPEWAGASIPLNAVAPGVVFTPMTASLTATEESREAILKQVPMPLNGMFGPESVASLLDWLTSKENAHLCGQVIFIDGGSDAIIRGDSTW